MRGGFKFYDEFSYKYRRLQYISPEQLDTPEKRTYFLGWLAFQRVSKELNSSFLMRHLLVEVVSSLSSFTSFFILHSSFFFLFFFLFLFLPHFPCLFLFNNSQLLFQYVKTLDQHESGLHGGLTLLLKDFEERNTERRLLLQGQLALVGILLTSCIFKKNHQTPVVSSSFVLRLFFHTSKQVILLSSTIGPLYLTILLSSKNNAGTSDWVLSALSSC
jgi:hypothetical protein